MNDETSKRTATRTREVEIAPGAAEESAVARPESSDEDAAAFLDEAAAAAVARDAQLAEELAEVDALAAELEADAAELGARRLPAEEALEAAAAGYDAALLEELGAEATEEIADAPATDEIPDALEAEATEEIPDALEALPTEEIADGSEPEAGGDAAVSAAEEAAELVRELSENSQTAEEQLLEQSRDEEGEEAPAEISEYDEEAFGSLEKIAAKARRLSEEQARNVLHSILFVSDKPLTVEALRNATGLEPARIRASLERLAGELREGISGVVLSEVGDGWQLRTAPESSEFVRRFLQVKPRRLTRAALETLAIIAYRQPVTRPEIEDIRGVDCGAVVKALLDWKLIKILGKKDEVGRPLLYGTTREFLEFFQLKDLASLPTLREFHELTEESRQIVEEELGPEAAASISGTVAELADPAYLEAERERVAKSEAALAELEQAMADAEQKATIVAETINPPKAEPEEPPTEAEGS